MLLTVRDVAAVLHVSENAVERWAGESALPAMRIAGQYRFNRTELLEWATIRQMTVDPNVFHLGEADPGEIESLADALKRGGIGRLDAPDLRSAYRQVDMLALPPQVCAHEIVDVFSARGPAAWSSASGGNLLPHPRYPVVLPIEQPILRLCFLSRPSAPSSDGVDRTVDAVFLLLSPTVKTHLTLLAVLSGALSDSQFAEAVRRRAPDDAILKEARRFEADYRRNGNGGAKRP